MPTIRMDQMPVGSVAYLVNTVGVIRHANTFVVCRRGRHMNYYDMLHERDRWSGVCPLKVKLLTVRS